MILANLATHVKGSLNRLEVIKQSVDEAKEKFSRMNKEEATNYTALTLAPSGITLLTGLMPKWLAFNVVISNVPGPQQAQYWNGAKLERFYPVSAIVNHMALNITIVSYEDRLEFGIGRSLGSRPPPPNADAVVTSAGMSKRTPSSPRISAPVGVVHSPSSSPVVVSMPCRSRSVALVIVMLLEPRVAQSGCSVCASKQKKLCRFLTAG